MPIRQIPPPKHLQGYVRYFWIAEESPTVKRVFRPITDGCPGIIWQPSTQPLLTDQHNNPLPALFLYGQTVEHRELHARNGFNAIGVCLQPFALKALFGLDADELTDTCTDLSPLSAKQTPFLTDQLQHAPASAHQLELLSRFLYERISQSHPVQDSSMAYAVEQLIRTGGNLSMLDLQRQLSISERALERRFKRWVGVSPKLFSRICRFQSSLAQLRGNQYNRLSDIAFDNGYADQAHFIRIFKEFTGYPPRQQRNQPDGGLENLALWIGE